MCFAVRIDHSKAQGQQEVAPYEFAHTEGDVHVYKMIHEGCEIYIVRGHAFAYERSDTVSIATGKGCK